MKRGQLFQIGFLAAGCAAWRRCFASFLFVFCVIAPGEPATAQRAENQASASPASEEEARPGFDALLEESQNLPEKSPEGWYDVDDAAATGARQPGLATNTGEAIAPPRSDWAFLDRLQEEKEAAIALFLLLALLVALIVWRLIHKRRQTREINEWTTPVLTTGIRASMGANVLDEAEGQTGEDEPESGGDEQLEEAAEPEAEPDSEPAPEPKAEALPPQANQALTPRTAPARTITSKPLDIDLSLDIITASRSVMQLMVEFSLEVFNRSHTPIHRLTVAAELACVNEGAAAPAPVDKTQPIGVIERLAPQQNRRIKGYLELPAEQLSAIQQGERPLYIPLVHFRIAEHNQPAIKRTFVLGMPSASSATRVHPLPLDAPPGRLPLLRAQLIKQPG
ncbi:hypothetical protein INR77_05735 [Erythrobacter sp. SCSIO 43205]|uniref:hypothetical protein n=1 Tax=Erythrobacter sp. SCSIO 43205 TaxID=2779361 RepID=UPI001CA9B785|nr:hypothetical protein [Erythrobacter sp. SCSIO 43205]UAB79182.1 hypothetical protein INR77_05735 [Erythrobacter sp. SCSIO 43205]